VDRRESPFEHAGRGVGDARVDVVVLLEGVEGGRGVRVLELVGGGLIDGGRGGPRGGVRLVARVETACIEAEIPFAHVRDA
jgi:hypothetical protein